MQASWGSRQLGRVCVLGFGRTGLGVAEYLLEQVPGRVTSIDLYGGASSQPDMRTQRLAARGVRVVCGTDELDASYDVAIVSPGIPEHSAFFASACEHAAVVMGEPEFAWRESPQRWVGITGTNGKTTTTLLTTELLCAGGLNAKAVGNIGIVATGEVPGREDDSWFVAELSSFQLATSSEFHPRTACLLNITPDHLEWHGSIEEYAAAKERIFDNLAAGDLAVISDDDELCRDIAARLEARGIRVCRVSVNGVPDGRDSAFVRDGRLVVRRDGTECPLVLEESLSLEGAHNVFNALTASAMALHLGISVDAVCHALLMFKPLEHRIEPCGMRRGVRYINDSKATNVDAVAKALTSFEAGRIVVLLGGHDKGTELDSLCQAVGQRCRVAVCYGEAGPRIARALRKEPLATGLEVVEKPHLAEAFVYAASVARKGEVVLLSPACSSFDEFGSFQERGSAFKDMVAQLDIEDGLRC